MSNVDGTKEQLAIHGGTKTKQTPFGTGQRFGQEELKELTEALEQGTLFYHLGGKVKRFLDKFNEMHDVRYSVAASSGTAAIHIALGTAGVSVGDEVITSPISDMGTLIGILYQNAIPVFADLNPHTYNMDPISVEVCITSRTKAIVVVHLAGNPCDMDAIMAIARKHNLIVIEDCAQSYQAKYKGRYVGTIGDYGCFSTNDFKHISTGDGGMVTINSDDEMDFYRTHAFADKNYHRFDNVVIKDIQSLAPNYRMTELQGAVGIAQLDKLESICQRRRTLGDRISEGLKGLKGISVHHVEADAECSYWFYMMRLKLDELSCTRSEFCEALIAEGVPCGEGYIAKPLYLQPLFQQKQAYLGSSYPFDMTDTSYEPGSCPIAEQILETAVRMPVNEFYTDEDIEDMIRGVRKVALYYHL